MLSAEQIARAEAVNIGDAGSERGFTFRKGNHVGPCPRCGGKDRFSISVRKGVFLCRQCYPKGGGGAIRLVMFLDSCGFRDAVEMLTGARDFRPARKAAPLPKHTELGSGHSDFARAIWREAVNPRSTLAERYHNGRDLALDDDLCGRVLRFHPRCPFGKDDAGKTIYVPALIVAFRPFRNDDETRPPQAIHRIGLNPDGSKLGKMMLGPVGGCAVKLDPDENVEEGLGIVEGIETGLGVRMTGWRPVWCLGSKGAIAKIEPIPGIDCLTVFADHDDTGLAAARECARRCVDAGCEAVIHRRSADGKDFADA